MPIGLPEGDVPSEVMVFPAGVHKIVASRAGEPVTATVSIGPEAARAMQASLQAHLAAGPQKPWFDFDHANGPASAWPIGFEWRDAPTPGVYAKVEWSKAGKEAIEGKMYRAFSPVFHVDKSTPAKVTGAPLNMGALVNAPAFREISPIWAQARQQKEGNNKMTEQELAALQARNTELESENKALKASANTAALEAKHNTAIAAKDSEITLLKNEVTTLKAAAQERAKNDAKAAVSAAVARGALPPKDEAIQAKWRSLIEADPSNAELLGKLQGNPALQASTTASLAAGATGSGATGGEAEQFVEAVKAKHAELKDRSKAVDAAIAACPAGYTAWRNANGKPGLVFA